MNICPPWTKELNLSIRLHIRIRIHSTFSLKNRASFSEYQTWMVSPHSDILSPFDLFSWKNISYLENLVYIPFQNQFWWCISCISAYLSPWLSLISTIRKNQVCTNNNGDHHIQRVNSVLGFFSSRPNIRIPPIRRRVCPPPFGSGGCTHSLAGEGEGGPNFDEETDPVVLYTVVQCAYMYFVITSLFCDNGLCSLTLVCL